MTQAQATIGHNNPPSDEELLQAKLLEKSQQRIARHAELLADVDRLPDCNDDEIAGRFTDFIKQITACHKDFESARVGEKEPFLNLGRKVDGFFKRFTDQLETAKSKVNKPLTDYLRRKEEKARSEARAEQDRQRAEAERLAIEAAALESANMPKAAANTLQEATQAEAHANDAQKVMQAKAADLSRTRGDNGGVASLRKRWVGTITDEALIDWNLLREFIPIEAKRGAVQAWARTKQTALAGANIREEYDVAVR